MINQCTEPENQKFFKYMSCSTARVVLENTTLRWTTPATLNDPYDGQFDLHIDVEIEQVKAAALEKLWRVYSGEEVAPIGNMLGVMLQLLPKPEFSHDQFMKKYEAAIAEGIARCMQGLPNLQAEARQMIARAKILCLSHTPTSTLMWTHYAEDHKGVMLKFRTVPELDSPWPTAKPINYVDQMPRLLDAEFLSDMLSGRTSFDTSSLMNRMLFTKSAEWSYEQEWRIDAGMGRNPEAQFEDVAFHPLELDAVVFGTRTPKDEQDTIVGIVGHQYPHAELLQIEKNQREFSLELTPYVRQ